MPTQNLLRFVTVANVDDEDRVGNSLLQIWELRFDHKAKLLFRLTPSLISLQFVCDEMLMFGWDFEVSVVEIMKQKFDQDLCLNLWYEPLGYFGKMNSTPRVCCAFGNVFFIIL